MGRSAAAHILLGGLTAAALLFGLDNPLLRVYPWTAAALWSAWALAELRLEGRRLGLRWDEHRPEAFLFLLPLTAYLGTFRWHGGDDITNSMLPYCLLRHGTLTLEPFRELMERNGLIADFAVSPRGRLLSFFPIAPGIMALPVYLLPVLGGTEPTEVMLHNLSKISASLIGALSCVFFYRAAAARSSPAWAARVTLLYALGTYAFSVASQALYQHGPANLGVAIALCGLLARRDLPRDARLAGLGFGLAAACRPENALFLGLAGLFYLVHRRARLGPFALGAAVCLLPLAAYWLAYTGRPLPPEAERQSVLFGGFQWGRVWAMLASPSRGLVFFMPAGLFGFWGMWRAWRRGERAVPYLLAGLLGIWALYAARDTWTGGGTYGNRYFSLVCMLLAFFCADLEEDLARPGPLRGVWAASFAFSVLVHAVGAYFTWPGSFVIAEQEARLWDPVMFPLAHLFAGSSSVARLPLAARTGVALALAAATAGFAGLLLRPAGRAPTSSGGR